MSYNITEWKVRTINLTLPLIFDFRQWLHMQPDRDEKGYENVGKRWCMEDEESKLLVDFASQTWKLACAGPTLSGVLQTVIAWSSLILRVGQGTVQVISIVISSCHCSSSSMGRSMRSSSGRVVIASTI